MGKVIFIILAALLLAGCGGDTHCDHVKWKATFHASESDTTSTGGTTIEISGKGLSAPAPRWRLDVPVAFDGEVPPPDLAAIGEALLLAGPGRDVMDAVASPAGTVSLLRIAGDGMVITLLGEGPDDSTQVPDTATRLVPLEGDPPAVLILTTDGLAIRAIRP